MTASDESNFDVTRGEEHSTICLWASCMELKILKRQTVCWTAKGNKTPFGCKAIFALLLPTKRRVIQWNPNRTLKNGLNVLWACLKNFKITHYIYSVNRNQLFSGNFPWNINILICVLCNSAQPGVQCFPQIWGWIHYSFKHSFKNTALAIMN